MTATNVVDVDVPESFCVETFAFSDISEDNVHVWTKSEYPFMFLLKNKTNNQTQETDSLPVDVIIRALEAYIE